MIVSLTDKIRFIESVFGKGMLGKNSLNFDVKCPIPTCHSRKDPTKKKLSIHTPSFMCHCWSCGYSARTISSLLWKYNKSKLADFKTRFLGEEVVDTTEEKDGETPNIELPEGFRLIASTSTRDVFASAAKRYVTSRGLTEDDIWYHKLGVASDLVWERRVIMPSFDATGQLNYLVGRAYAPKVHPPYKYPDKPRSTVVFNSLNIDWTKRLVLCEGPFDMVKCGSNATAMLGSYLNESSELFRMIVMSNTPVALAMDADTWYTKMQVILKKLAEYNIDTLVVDTRAFKDPGAMTKKEFNKALGEAKPFDWFDSFEARLTHVSGVKLSV